MTSVLTRETPFGTVSIIDEGRRFKYGTKQRVSKDYVAHWISKGYNEFIYAGPVNALGAFALAWGCQQNNVRATLFLVGTRLPPQSKGFSSLIRIRLMRCSLRDANDIAEKNVSKSNYRMMIPFGAHDPLYLKMLETSFEMDLDVPENPKNIWIAVGSGAILSVLLKLFPRTTFHAVQVGKSLNIDNLSDDPQTIEEYRKRIVLYWSPERFTHPAQIRPPYSSLMNYDAKIWRFVLKHGQDKDCIWNVAGDFSR